MSKMNDDARAQMNTLFRDAGYTVCGKDVFMTEDGKYYAGSKVSTDGGKTLLGFCKTQIPNPADDDDTRLENMMDIYSSGDIVKATLNSMVITNQRARQVKTDKFGIDDLIRIVAKDPTLVVADNGEATKANAKRVWEQQKADNTTTGLRLF